MEEVDEYRALLQTDYKIVEKPGECSEELDVKLACICDTETI
jgi:hypothetical protein